MLQCPQTIFTFECLKTVHELTLQGKTNLYDYYHTLLWLSDNANLSAPIVSLPLLSNLTTDSDFNSTNLTRSTEYLGCGETWWLSSKLVMVTTRKVWVGPHKGGSWLNVLHVCNQDETSLMDGKRLDHYCKFSWLFSCLYFPNRLSRFLYALFIAVDGNFKLKGKKRNLKDVELMPGWGAYVPEDEYQTHLANCIDEPEVSRNRLVGNVNELIKSLVDQYMWISTQCACSCQHPINSRIGHLWCRFGYLLKTLPDTQKWSRRPEEGWKVRYFKFYFIHLLTARNLDTVLSISSYFTCWWA